MYPNNDFCHEGVREKETEIEQDKKIYREKNQNVEHDCMFSRSIVDVVIPQWIFI